MTVGTGSNDDSKTLDLAVLKTVRSLTFGRARKLTFGQIYMELVRVRPHPPSLAQCVVAVDGLVREGLLVSERLLDVDPAFPSTRYIISGLSEIGAASLSFNEEMHHRQRAAC